MIKKNIFSIGLLLISLNIYGQTTYTFLDSISNEPISGVAVFSNDSLISISNVDGLVRIDKTNEQIFSIKHSLYYQKNIKLNSNVIVLSPRYQFLEEVTVKYEDCFDLF